MTDLISTGSEQSTQPAQTARSLQSPNLAKLEERMADCWTDILSRPLAKQIKEILASGDRSLYALWLCQVAHLTRHTSAHQALVGTRASEISHVYARFCFEHALEEVGHEMMAVNDLKRIGAPISGLEDLPPPLPATTKLNAYLYFVSERGHPATRLGFSYWAEACYPFIQSLVSETQKSLGLENRQMTFFVSHAEIDEKHAADVERIISKVCQTPEDWAAVESGMVESLEMAIGIFEEIYKLMAHGVTDEGYRQFLGALAVKAP